MSPRENVAGSRSDTGCVREHNEDSLIVKAPLYAVADGMGGHAAGEVASQIAVDILASRAHSIDDAESLIDTVRTINRTIISSADSGTGRPGMGTTLTVAVLDGPRMLIAQVGDSRAYVLHKDKLQQLTRDHSYVGELLAGGHISASEAAVHPKRSVITRALGSDPKTEADIYELEAQVGDRLLLCSDGLYGMVPDEDIAAILISEPDPQIACDLLIARAREGGGLDNISAIVVDINSNQSEFLVFSGTDSARDQGNLTRRGHTHAQRSGRSRRVYLGIITFVLLLIVLVGGAIGGVYWYASQSAFLRSNDAGMVEVYRGLPGEVLPGIRLEWLEYTTDVEASDLLSTTAERLEEGVQVDSLNDAATLVADYEKQILDREIKQSQPSSGSSGSSGGSDTTGNTSSSGSSGLASAGTAGGVRS